MQHDSCRFVQVILLYKDDVMIAAVIVYGGYMAESGIGVKHASDGRVDGDSMGNRSYNMTS